MNEAIQSLASSSNEQAQTEVDVGVRSATEQAYYYDWSQFAQWCAESGHTELPAHPEVVSLFLKNERNSACGLATLTRRIAAICYFHKQNGFLSPMLHKDVNLIHRVMAEKSQAIKRKTSLKLNNRTWGEIIHSMPDSNIEDIRDRAILAIHVAVAFRSIELARLSYGQLRIERQLIQINLGRFRSNTCRGASTITVTDDQIIYPMSRLRRWILAGKIKDGAVFRHCQGGQSSQDPLDEKDILCIIAERVASAGYQLPLSPSRKVVF